MWNMQVVSVALVYVLTFACLPDGTDGWAYMKEGACPSPHKPGDVWYEGCSKCHCHTGAYACYGCGAVSLPLKPGCYKDYRNENAIYPGCCDVIAVCPGDKRYDPSKINNIIGK